MRRITRYATPSRTGICMTRERLLQALRQGELEIFARDVTLGRLIPDDHGVLIAPGTYATLPWTGDIEVESSTTLGPPGEVRVSRRPDGRLWLYFLGGLLGRHQNQVGFVYSSAPFLPSDFKPDGPDAEQVCLDGYDDADQRPRRYLLSCFTVVKRLSGQLLEVLGAPD